jgi:hypothetical protein
MRLTAAFKIRSVKYKQVVHWLSTLHSHCFNVLKVFFAVKRSEMNTYVIPKFVDKLSHLKIEVKSGKKCYFVSIKAFKNKF